MNKNVSQHVRQCHPCQASKPTRKINPAAKTFKVPPNRFSHLHVDVVGPLPESEGMRYLLTILDRKTRFLECVAMLAATSKNCCNAFIRGWLSRYGAATEIVADNGNTFTAGLWTDLNRILGIKVKFIPLYHQSTKGALERQHRTLKESIKASLVEMGDTHRQSWMSQLPFSLLGRRIALQPDLGSSSAELLYRSNPVIPGIALPDPDPADRQLNNHELLKTLQQNASRDPVPMSNPNKKNKTTYHPIYNKPPMFT